MLPIQWSSIVKAKSWTSNFSNFSWSNWFFLQNRLVKFGPPLYVGHIWPHLDEFYCQKLKIYVFGGFSYCKSHCKRKWLALSQIKGYKLFFCTYAHYIYGDSIISLGEVSKSIMLIIGAPYWSYMVVLTK